MMGTHSHTGKDLKERGQRATAWQITPEMYDVLRQSIRALPPLSTVTVNDLRDDLDRAQVPTRLRGRMFRQAVDDGLLAPLEVIRGTRTWKAFESSTGKSAHAAQVRVYVTGL